MEFPINFFLEDISSQVNQGSYLSVQIFVGWWIVGNLRIFRLEPIESLFSAHSLVNFKKVTNECAENNVLPITFEIVNDEYAENKNLADYF